MTFLISSTPIFQHFTSPYPRLPSCSYSSSPPLPPYYPHHPSLVHFIKQFNHIDRSYRPCHNCSLDWFLFPYILLADLPDWTAVFTCPCLFSQQSSQDILLFAGQSHFWPHEGRHLAPHCSHIIVGIAFNPGTRLVHSKSEIRSQVLLTHQLSYVIKTQLKAFFTLELRLLSMTYESCSATSCPHSPRPMRVEQSAWELSSSSACS